MIEKYLMLFYGYSTDNEILNSKYPVLYISGISLDIRSREPDILKYYFAAMV